MTCFEMNPMKLEFKKEFIPKHLFKELDFEGFLNLFKTDLKIIPHVILQPLGKSDAELHYGRLSNLKEQISRLRLNLDFLFDQCKQLPAVDYLLPFFKDKQLEGYHLFDLGRFITEDQKLASREEQIPLDSQKGICSKIRKILLKHLAEDYSSLKLNADEEKLHHAILDINQTLSAELQNLENKIFQETGIRIVYPFPKKINKSDKRLGKIKSSSDLNLKEQGDAIQLEINPQEPVVLLQEKKEELSQQLKLSLTSTLNQVNESLSDWFDSFNEYYKQRKQRVLDYTLLRTAKIHHLQLPKLSSSTIVTLKKGILPELQQKEAERYNPLDIHLKNGVNVLFGANMTGKTTALKTLYFHLVLAKFGLPVPAKSLELGFPEQTKLQLRSSGRLITGLSGFGDELRLFCELSNNSSVYLIDELFHSTDPTNGVKLTKAFLNGLSDSNSIFLCTSHYPEILELTNITLYKMKDIEKMSTTDDLQSLLENIPYEVEPISAKDLQGKLTHSNHPLEVALQFPLPEKILKNIRKKLEK